LLESSTVVVFNFLVPLAPDFLEDVILSSSPSPSSFPSSFSSLLPPLLGAFSLGK